MALAKALIEIVSNKDVIPVMFNPNEYKINKQVNYGNIEVQSIQSKMLTYQNGNPRTLSVELFYDMDLCYELVSGSHEDGVKKYADKIMQLTILGKDEMPPLCSFKWGNLIFTGYVTSVDESFTRFNSQGIPIRAVINVSMIENYVPEDNNSIQNLAGTLDDLYSMMENSIDWRKVVAQIDVMNPRKLV
ncbi:CIS tube protein [Clostridium saccharoperbutylacetonicum]